jgi:hypothetical protein
MKQIRITREPDGNVQFETVAVDRTETVFFINLDPQDEHQPDLINNKLGKAPSAPSSQANPDPSGEKTKVEYTCKIHGNEHGTILIFEPLAEANTTLADATHGQPIDEQQVVQGGMSPYQVSNQVFEVTNHGAIVDSGSGIGPGLQLTPTTDNNGIFVSGTPTLSGTYNFTFEVNDAMGANLQQVQYVMNVA